MFGTYAPRVYVHPDRYGARKTAGPNTLIVLHTSEGGESEGAAENLASFLGRPGDRPNSSGGRFGSSYHAILDTDQILPAVPYDTVSYSAGGGNSQGIHGCFPGKAGQTREQWFDEVSRAMIRQAAAWMRDVAAEQGIPLRRLTVAQVAAGERGYCDHHDVSRAFRKSTHTDVGVGFPWDILASDIDALVIPVIPARPTDPNTTRSTRMFIVAVTNAPGSAVRETWLLCDGTQLSHISDGHAAAVYQAVTPSIDVVRPSGPDSAAQVAGLIKSTRTMNDCPPEWVGTGWATMWAAQRA